jgi:clan AA aspartic protease (TIGR02281 family)
MQASGRASASVGTTPEQLREDRAVKIVLGVLIAALGSTDVFAQTYECMSKLNPGTIYLSYGTPCPSGTDAKSRTTITADAQGQYFATANINGSPVRSQIDTGATTVFMNMDDAKRLGVDLTNARRGTAQTANGAISVLYVTLAKVQLGDIVLSNVPAAVGEGGARQQPHVLIGMSFLRQLEMKHVGNTLTLVQP